ncbi:pimeloyl-ACP methyl ester carboxylesterase [Actinokineospora baliensis]|uniref:alpha/beta fold hydrolase n=1 Tax=Actinokineospora baliensis TaxID=547056 RepID=UPI0027DB98BE|nr:alpha/beta hydrolase [Actinokineospora baliensis]MBM7772665.1 pimeloyl-ACP methyl ester carboxylesterase [Actinokineospora baliensis]
MPPLLLFHAFPLDSRMWDGVRAELSAHVRLITPDQRGFGRAPLGEAVPSLDVVAADAIALLDSLAIERVVVGGCSMGGYVAMALLRHAPKRVAGLLLVDTKAPADTEEAAANRLAMAERAEREGIVPWLADTMLPVLGGTAVHGQVRGWLEEQSPKSVAWTQRAMAARPDSRDTLRGVTVDTLVVHGDADGLMPVSLGEEMAELARGSLVVLPGVGHLPPVEAPEAFAAAVVPWLASLS